MRNLIRPLNLVVKYCSYLSNSSSTHPRKLSTSIAYLSASTAEAKSAPTWGSNKKHRNIKLQLLQAREMADPRTEEILLPLREKVKEQVGLLIYFSKYDAILILNILRVTW